MIIIQQVLNDNAAMVTMTDHRQAIVYGQSLKRQHQRGDRLWARQIERIDYLDLHTSKTTLQRVLQELPLPVVTTTYEVLAMASSTLHMCFADYQYATVAAYILDVSDQVSGGTFQAPHSYLPVDRYPLEFAVAQRAFAIIRENLGVSWPRAAVRTLAQQMVPRPSDRSRATLLDDRQVRTLNQSIVSTLRDQGMMRTPVTANAYDRLLVHIQYLADRQRQRAALVDGEVVDMMKVFEQTYPKAATIAREIFALVIEQLGGMVNECELLYLALHVQRVTGEAGRVGRSVS